MKAWKTLGLATAMTLAGCFSVNAQFHLGKEKDSKEKSEILREKQEKADEKNARTYEKVKAYSRDKYDSDPEFKDQVDKAYDDLLREHMNEAFDNNMNRGSRIVAVHEDRVRVHTGLYDNLLVQDEINRLGQSLVPASSDKMFAFRLLPDPTPTAYTLATGTIYISTGMVALLDSQAQLAYVLAHEMAHVQLDHWKERVMMAQGADAYNVDQNKKAERVALVGGLVGGLTGGLASKSAGGAVLGAGLGLGAGYLIGSLLNRQAVADWDKNQEDEADKLAFKVMLDTRYDPREVPKLYATLETIASKDRRATLGFLGNRQRVRERRESASKLIQESYKAEIEAGLQHGYIGDTASHRNLMAELKRDNGIMAYYDDMFGVARKNLGDAVAIRDNDAEAQYFYGKVLETIGRTDDDHKLAMASFQKSAQFDTRKQNFGAHLHYALELMENDKNADQKQISAELDNYIAAWFRYLPEARKTDFLPPSIDSIYDYMSVYSAVEWRPKLPADLEALTVDYRGGYMPTGDYRTLMSDGAGSSKLPAGEKRPNSVNRQAPTVKGTARNASLPLTKAAGLPTQ